MQMFTQSHIGKNMKKPTEYNVKCLHKRPGWNKDTTSKELLQRQSNNQEMFQRSKTVKITLPTVRFLEKKE
jgi:hypothetical protein